MKNFPIAVLLTDTHLFEKRTRLDAIIDCNFDEVYLAFKEAIKQAQDNGLDKVFHAGDFFDSRKHQSQSLMEMAEKILDLFTEANIVLYLISGNHDKTSYEHEYSFLKPFYHHPNLKLISKYDFLDEGKVRFHFLAFFDNDIYVDNLKSLAIPNIADDKKNILITHIGIHGALNHSGEKEASSITFEMFKDFDKVLIGHFHNYSSHIKEKIVYIGSAIQHSFGEDNNKGIMILDDILHLRRIRTEFREYQTNVVNVEDLTQSDIKDLLAEQVNNHQKLVLVGKEDLIRTFDKTALLNFGVKVEMKAEALTVKDIQQRLSAHDDNSILENFDLFCKEHSFDINEGLIYLK